MSVKTEKECKELWNNFLTTFQSMYKSQRDEITLRVDRSFKQHRHNLTLPIPGRDVRSNLRDEMKQMDKEIAGKEKEQKQMIAALGRIERGLQDCPPSRINHERMLERFS